MTTIEKVKQLLETIPQTRANDNLLIAYFMKDVYKVQNTFDIALKFNVNVYETIRRARQKAQELDPALRPSDEVYQNRLKKEKEVREQMRQMK